MTANREAYDPLRLKHSDCLLAMSRKLLKLVYKMDLDVATLEKRCPRHPEVKPVVLDLKAITTKMIKAVADATTLANKLKSEGNDPNAESLELPNPFTGLAGMLMPNPFNPPPDKENQEEE